MPLCIGVGFRRALGKQLSTQRRELEARTGPSEEHRVVLIHILRVLLRVPHVERVHDKVRRVVIAGGGGCGLAEERTEDVPVIALRGEHGRDGRVAEENRDAEGRWR